MRYSDSNFDIRGPDTHLITATDVCRSWSSGCPSRQR